MAIQMQLDDYQSLKVKLDERSSNLFRAKPGVAQLSVSRYGKTIVNRVERSSCLANNKELLDTDSIVSLRHDQDSLLQIYTVRQDRSWTTLNCSRTMFQDLLTEYNVFLQFWKCVFTFGRKTVENEFEFPGFRARTTMSPESIAETEGIEAIGELYGFTRLLLLIDM